METKRAARGFTLVELVLAIGIAAILAMLAMQALDGWRERVMRRQAIDDIALLSTLIELHVQDNRTLPDTLADIGRGGMLDPWGRAYRYLPLNTPASRGKARKDHSLVPLNTDYDLYSVGPDGETVAPLTGRRARDDILRANNGRFIGAAADY